MKRTDIDRLREAGLITDEQHGRVLERFHLEAEPGRFLGVVSLLGGLLVAAGILLLVGAHWEDIPPGLKIAAALALLVATHASGARLTARGNWPRTAEALHVTGAILFLATIALVGQIYHLQSRTPDAWLLWWLGIAPLPWILRSRALHLLSLGAGVVWLGTEAWSADGWLRFGTGGWPIIGFALLGIAGYGWGLALRRGRWRLFAEDTQRFFLVLLSACLVPLAIREFQSDLLTRLGEGAEGSFGVMLAVASAALVYGLRSDTRFSPDWRWRWGGGFAALGGLLALIVAAARMAPHAMTDAEVGAELAAVGSLFVFAFGLLEVRVGVQVGSAWLVNLGMGLLAAVTITTYVALIGSMTQTGLIFVISGGLLVGFGAYLEKKRRDLVRGLHDTPRPEALT